MVKTSRETKALQRFRERVNNLKQNLDLFDATLRLSKSTCTKNKTESDITIAEALGTKIDIHKRLDIPNKNKDIERTFASARKALHEQTIVNLYSFFSDYMRNIIKALIEAKRSESFWKQFMIDKKNTMQYSDIIEALEKQNLTEKMANHIFRILENKRSTIDLIGEIVKVTKVQIDESLLNEALVYLEIRHLIIHNNSRPDDKFKELLRKSGSSIQINPSKNQLILNFALSSKAIEKISTLCECIDDELIEKELVDKRN